jgi:group I intron endonuclease
MFYIIYKITNQINGKFYIGSHKTRYLNDKYMGSGKYLKYAQEKYGIENFTKEILFVFDTPEQMYAKEAEIVNEFFISEENTYNVKVGGYGGWDYNNSKITSEERARRGKNGSLKSSSTGKIHLHPDIENIRKKAARNRVACGKSFNNFQGKKHTLESKLKMSASMQGKQNGEKNSQFGTIWITNGEVNKKIKNTEDIPFGWKKGRIKNHIETHCSNPNQQWHCKGLIV